MLNLSGYTITEKIYEDEKTLVYRGIRAKDDLSVIIKQLNSEHPSSSDIMKLKHEFEISRMINSEYIVKIYDLIEIDNLPHLIVEDCNGVSLRQIISSKKISIKDFFSIAIKIADALSEIHNFNIVHNDVNPGNIIINPETNTIKLTDFGIAALLSKDNRNITCFPKIEGTLSYISPEQTGRMNRSIDYRTDFYSLGITLYEMLLGFLPFYAEDYIGLIYCHLAKEPVAPADADSTIPRIVSDIIMKLMEKMAENRYQSAKGLKNDLEECLKKFLDKGMIEYFEVGKKDASSRFRIPQQLFGRDNEIKKLISAFEHINHGEMEIVAVSGYCGSGKSSLVNELQKFVVKHRGFFSSGKFDQLNYDSSYSALIQAINGIINQIISQEKNTIEKWKNNILEFIGPNGKVIIDVIPSLELVIGNQPEVPALPPVEAQNRFNLVFKNFIKCFCSKEHPLVIFLDDMQWCDLATLRLLEALITDADTKHFLMIFAYRDNEVYGVHPLLLTLDNINNSGVAFNSIHIKPLQLKDIIRMLSQTFQIDSYNSNIKKVNKLASICLKKTEGNPFFLIQFLYLLYQENLIWFDINHGFWDFDIDKILKADLTDNVVELMIRKIQKLSPEAQKLLTYSACIGNKFDLEYLSFLYEKSMDETYELLIQALFEGLILVDNTTAANVCTVTQRPGLRFYFLHDRIQQAAYGLINDVNKKNIHLELGRLILSKTNKSDFEEKVFDILNHYNLGIDLIYDPDEKKILSELELLAGKKAMKAIAYDLSYKYYKSGIDLMEDDCWDKQYRLSLDMYTGAAEAAYLNGYFNDMADIIDIVNRHALTILDKVELYKIRIQACVSQVKISEAVDLSIEIIELLGLTMPRNPNKIQIFLKLIKLRISLKNKNIEGFINLPDMQNKYYSSIISIISLIGAISYRTDPVFMSMILVEAIKLLAAYGNTPDAPFLYAGYGLVSCSLGDIETGYRFGKLALKLTDVMNSEEQKSRVIFMNNAFIAHWKEHLRDLTPAFKEGYKCGLNAGDLEFASYNGFYYCNNAFYTGKNLKELEQEMSYFIESIKIIHQTPQLHLIEMMSQIVQNLRGKSKDPTVLSGNAYDENAMMEVHYNTKDNTAVCSVYILKLILCYLFEDFTNAELNSRLTEEYLVSLQSTVAVPTYYFYNSLAKLAIYNQSSRIKQKEILKEVNINLKKMRKWAAHGPMNYSHKLYLIEAEKSRVLNKDINASEYYAMAIKLSNENKFIQEEALANELACKYYLQKGDKKLARLYMEEAHYCYTLWGADEKAKQLELKYTPLLYSRFEFQNIHSSSINSFSSNSNTNALMMFDSAAILKTTQAISGEIRMEELLKKLVKILLENSGAQRVVYLMKLGEEFVVGAEGSSINNCVDVFQNYYISEYSGIPKKVYHYVNHSKQLLILNNPSEQGNFIDDPYFSLHDTKSSLCMPVLSKNEICGIFYLENSLIEGAFSCDRVEILKIISSQFAISMENARMYQDLETLNNSLELKVQERTAELSKTLERIKKQDIDLKEMVLKVYSLLDNSGEGFLSFNQNFIIDPEYSSECNTIFSRDISGINVAELLFNDDETSFKAFFKSVNMIMSSDDDYKNEILLSLQPTVLTVNSKVIRLKYRVLENKKIMLILTDISREKELEEKVKTEQERLRFIVSSFVNRDELIDVISSFKDFIKSGLDRILAGSNMDNEKLSEIYRIIHTYKGIFSQFSFINTPKALSKLENDLSLLLKNIGDFSSTIRYLFVNNHCYKALENDINTISEILGSDFLNDKTGTYITEEQVSTLKSAAQLISKKYQNNTENVINNAINIINTLQFKDLKEMFESYPNYVVKLSERLGKKINELKIEGTIIKVDPIKYSSFVKSLIHVFHNCLDHGIEKPDERICLGKQEKGNISCKVEFGNGKIIISISDDGKGIDINFIRNKAIEKQIISPDDAKKQSDHEIMMILFSDNFSTKDSASDISGRGFGLSAVMSELRKLSGSVTVESMPLEGTRFLFSLPLNSL